MSRHADLRELPIVLDRSGRTPIQRALGDALRAAMLTGRLDAGARLPSSRDLGAQLGIARGTVVAVYDQLTAEGYLVSRRGSGTCVAEALPDRWFQAAPAPTVAPRAPPGPRLSRWGASLAGSPFGLGRRSIARPFRAHIPAVDRFPAEAWGRLVAKRARQDEKLLLGDGDVRGERGLREALAAHLRVARGVVCNADQIVIVPSVQQALDLAARLAVDPGDPIWIEDPGYTGARAVLDASGGTLVPVPVDDQGLDVAAGLRLAPKARLVYVTPGHQAPLGVTMTLDRRLALLQWASARRALVIEDDYDSEYRYEGRPVPALQSLDRAGVVLHTGTFSKTLLPSLRLAYAVVPDAWLDAFLAAKSRIDRFTPPLLQAALADFLNEGHFGRHLRRMREVYAERRSALLSALASELGRELHVVGASAGLDVAVRFAKARDDRALEQRLGEAGIEAFALSRHSMHRTDVNGFLLGFAAFTPARTRKAIAAMAAIVTRSRRS